jgi:hypothetical protein
MPEQLRLVLDQSLQQHLMVSFIFDLLLVKKLVELVVAQML